MSEPAPDVASEIFAVGALRGRSVLVTGGGTGLGRETALELARCGASVTITGRREEVLAEAAAGAAGMEGEIGWVAGDVREVEEARRIVGEVLARRGRLDVLVNNAGGQFFSPAELIVAKGWRAVWRLNVGGMLNMAEAAHELAFAEAGSGTVINVTLSPHHGMPGMVHSGAARATVEALTAELAARWAPEGVSVVAVAAGHFATEVTAKYPESVRAGASRTVPLQRLGEPIEHAWLVAMLASPLGRGFSGSTVTLDGARDNWFGPWPPPGLAGDDGAVPVEERKGAGAVEGPGLQ
ncbi:MAG TPA: SDR family oxidoreductase [Solirubrobacteraceae bacterium]|nr:SDR family oxidoreductase [Solirubrobacteraceae bacterium]